jgi:hypothetical protein
MVEMFAASVLKQSPKVTCIERAFHRAFSGELTAAFLPHPGI